MVNLLSSYSSHEERRFELFSTHRMLNFFHFFLRSQGYKKLGEGLCPCRPRTPFLQVFVCEDRTGLLELLNAIYANNNIHLLPIGANWYSASKDSMLGEFKEIHSLEMLAQKYDMTTDRRKHGFFQEASAIATTNMPQLMPSGPFYNY